MALTPMARNTEKKIDEALKETFPASDPPAFVGGGTREEKFPPAGPHDKPEQRDAGRTPGAGALPAADDKGVTPGTG